MAYSLWNLSERGMMCVDPATEVYEGMIVGIHSRDNDRLIKTLLDLRGLGNTVLVVEHDEDTIFSADYLVDIGPGAGVHGGEVVVADDLEKLSVRVWTLVIKTR